MRLPRRPGSPFSEPCPSFSAVQVSRPGYCALSAILPKAAYGTSHACINKALDALPPMQRAAVALRDMQGMDMETICNILEISESNGRVLLHRGRSSVQMAIEEHEKR